MPGGDRLAVPEQSPGPLLCVLSQCFGTLPQIGTDDNERQCVECGNVVLGPNRNGAAWSSAQSVCGFPAILHRCKNWSVEILHIIDRIVSKPIKDFPKFPVTSLFFRGSWRRLVGI